MDMGDDMINLDELDKLATEALTTAKQTGAMPFTNTMICVGMTPTIVARIRELEAQLATARDAALEEAACVADKTGEDAREDAAGVCGTEYHYALADAADDIGSDIRALKARTPGEST
jgi:hypothetical protein